MDEVERDGRMDPDKMTGERLVSHCPVVIRRRVLWGECDPAGVVYTPRFADFMASAYFWFQRVVLTEALRTEGGAPLMTPIKALSVEFAHVLRPGELFDMSVTVGDIRTRTFDVVIRGRSPDGDARFEGRMTPVVCDPEFHSVALPGQAREALSAYQRRCTVNV